VEKEKAKLFPTERPHKDVWAGLANEAGSIVLQGWEGGYFIRTLNLFYEGCE